MIVTITIGILCVLLAFIAEYKETSGGLEWSFFLIFLFLALRYDFGSDYNTYLDAFHEINAISLRNLFASDLHFEVGWILLCTAFRPFGFFAMTAFLAAFNCIVYYRFIKIYVEPNFYWLAVFIYFFSPSLMLVHASAMRQSLSIALFLFSLEYLYRKDVFRYYLCVAIAVAFHTSALILAPLYVFRILNWKINITILAGMILGFLALIPFGGLLPIINVFISSNFDRYEYYQEPAELSSGLGFIILIFQVALILYFMKFQSDRDSLFFKISLVGFIFVPLGLLIAMIVRLSMYFEPLLITVYPLIALTIKNSLIKTSFIILMMAYIIYILFPFFKPGIWNFEEYHTIFSSPRWY